MNRKGQAANLVAAHPGNRNAVRSAIYSPATRAPRVAELEAAIQDSPPAQVEVDFLTRELAALGALAEKMDEELAARGIRGRAGAPRRLVAERLRLNTKVLRTLEAYGRVAAAPVGTASTEAATGADGGSEHESSLLVAALATGKSYREAAEAAHVSVRTVARRMADQQFRSEVSRARERLVERALSQATDSMSDAIKTLQTLMRNSDSDSVKLRAARTILEFGGGRHQLTGAFSRTLMLDTTEAAKLVALVVDAAFDYIPEEAQMHFIERVRAAAH